MTMRIKWPDRPLRDPPIYVNAATYADLMIGVIANHWRESPPPRNRRKAMRPRKRPNRVIDSGS